MFFEDMKNFSKTKKKLFDLLYIINFTEVILFIKQYIHFTHLRFMTFSHLIDLYHHYTYLTN